MPLSPEIQQRLVEHYRECFLRHRDTPEGVQYSDASGQALRFQQLVKVGSLAGQRILDVGCGLGHLYPFLVTACGAVDYTGIDIVPETIAYAAAKHPQARFFCHDLQHAPLPERFDYVLMCGVFNNAMPGAAAFLREMVSAAFQQCSKGLAFNFISTAVNDQDPELAYHDPLEVMKFCLERLTRRVVIHHHYDRCDVSVFAYR